ncbi:MULTISPECIES: OmpP1/FadL family transporter [unclassified Burkholderia]|uniref:OmpP1/FadL family transporter n=1 Tax=unclassified Burkholderia TaxID=2613784 RepID=UPI000F57AB68|nr:MULTISPECIES: outer membrane protein transport protein [unclassified Burkholderia]
MEKERFGGVTRCAVFAGVLALFSASAQATNGNLMTGYGFSAASMGGASIGLPQDALGGANNPAGMAYVGTRFDVDMAFFHGYSDATYGFTGNTQSTHVNTPMPELGVNYEVTPKLTLGVSMYGAGEKTEYGRPTLPLPGVLDAKSYLLQLNVASTITYKITPTLAVGASVIGGFEQFRVSGFVVPGASGALQPVPSHGTATAYGIGGALGVLWKPVSRLSVGASYYTKMRYGRLSGYADDVLLKYGGHIDGPERYGVGIAFEPFDRFKVAFDWLHINWSTVAALADPATFGWRNQNVYRVGVSYALGSKWVLMAGYSHANSHVDTDHTLAAFFSPAVSEQAVTLGATYHVDSKNDVSFGLEHTIPRTMIGTGPSTGTNLKVGYDFFRLAYSHRF